MHVHPIATLQRLATVLGTAVGPLSSNLFSAVLCSSEDFHLCLSVGEGGEETAPSPAPAAQVLGEGDSPCLSSSRARLPCPPRGPHRESFQPRDTLHHGRVTGARVTGASRGPCRCRMVLATASFEVPP